MTDVRIKEFVSLEGVTMDFLLRSTGQLDERDELATAARVALGTDALAGPNDILPDIDSTNRRGWWGDLDAELIWDGWPIGCKNWLLLRAKITDIGASEGATLTRANQYTAAALQPFIDKKVASQMTVAANRVGLEEIDVSAQLYRGPEVEIDLRYQLLWQEPDLIEDVKPAVAPLVSVNIRVPYATLTLSSGAAIYNPLPFNNVSRRKPTSTSFHRPPIQRRGGTYP